MSVKLSDFASGVTLTDTDHVVGYSNTNTGGERKWTVANLRNSLITGAATTIDTENLTVSRALISDASGKVAASSITSTQLAQLDGITTTETIQSQLNKKQATITGAATTIDTENLTASRILVSDSNGKVTTSSIAFADAPVFIPTNYNTQSNSIGKFVDSGVITGSVSLTPWWSGIQTATVPNVPTNTVAVLIQVLVNCNTYANNGVNAYFYKESEATDVSLPSTSTAKQNITQVQYDNIDSAYVRITMDSNDGECEETATFPLYIDTTTNQFKWFITDGKNDSVAPSSTPEYIVNIRLLGYYVKMV
jgi:hypothetical protein